MSDLRVRPRREEEQPEGGVEGGAEGGGEKTEGGEAMDEEASNGTEVDAVCCEDGDLLLLTKPVKLCFRNSFCMRAACFNSIQVYLWVYGIPNISVTSLSKTMVLLYEIG